MTDWSDALIRARKALATCEAAAALGDYTTALQAAHAAEDHCQSLSHAIVEAQVGKSAGDDMAAVYPRHIPAVPCNPLFVIPDCPYCHGKPK